MEVRIVKINSMISNKSIEAKEGKIPTMEDLEKEIGEFLLSLKGLPNNEINNYTDVVQVWANEIREISKMLDETKAKLEKGISDAQNKTKAATAYASAGGLGSGDNNNN